MSQITGKTGSVILVTSGGTPGTDDIFLHIDKFTLNAPREDFDATTFDSPDEWEERVVGLVTWQGTIEGFYQDAGGAALNVADLSVDDADLTLTASTGRTYAWSGNVTIGNFDQNAQTGVPGRWTATFQANGTPAIT